MTLGQAVSGKLQPGTYNIGFNDGDETQFDVETLEELQECWSGFCKENGIDESSVDYVELEEKEG